MSERAEPSAPVDTAGAEARPLLSVVVPVFNQEAAIAENVETIRSSLEAGLGDDFELIVVSDGSIDRTAERVVEQHAGDVRVIHYDRNLGKGYAVKIGALEARGRYVGYIDADLDLDPAWLPKFVAAAQERRARLRDRLQAPSRTPMSSIRARAAWPAGSISSSCASSSGSTSATPRWG